MFRGIWLILLALCIAASVGGCTTLRGGGSPVPSFDVEIDLQALEKVFGSAVSIENVYKDGATEDKRDKMIAGRLVMMNLRYLQFIKSLNAEKQFIDTASDVTILSLNIAAAALTPNTATTVLSAISAAVAGSKVAVDKHYYYEKTMPALIAAMNAQRKQVLVSILQGMDKPLDLYPVEQAITDLDAYYHAGTLMGAINAIQVTASAQEKESGEKIEGITRARISVLLSSNASAQVQRIGDAIEGLIDFTNAQAVSDALGFGDVKFKDISEAKKQLKAFLRNIGHDETKIRAMYEVFVKNGLVK